MDNENRLNEIDPAVRAQIRLRCLELAIHNPGGLKAVDTSVGQIALSNAYAAHVLDEGAPVDVERLGLDPGQVC